MERDESLFLSALSQANQEIKNYVVRLLEADTGRGVTEYTRDLGEIEQVLGMALLRLGRQLVERAEERGFVIVETPGMQQEEGETAAPDAARRKPAIPEF